MISSVIKTLNIKIDESSDKVTKSHNCPVGKDQRCEWQLRRSC